MSTLYKGVITKNGKALLANAAIHSKINFTHIAVGDGSGSIPTPTETRSALFNEKTRIALNSVEIDSANNSQIICEAIIPSNQGGFTIRELGLYANTTLVVFSNYPATYKPAQNEGGARELIIRMVISVQNADVIALTVNHSLVYATREWVETNFVNHEEVIDNLSSTETKNPLSANQGRLLKEDKLDKTANAASASKLKAIDHRTIKPNQTAKGFTEVYFTTKNGLNSNNASDSYGDFLVLNQYGDSSGGKVNGLYFNKSTQEIQLYQANQSDVNWGTAKTIAFTDGNIATATKLQNARSINGIAFDGSRDITIEAKLAYHGEIKTEEQFNAANETGFYRVVNSPYISSLGLYSYGILVVYRTDAIIHQTYYAHQQNAKGAGATRQTWNGAWLTSNTVWRLIFIQVNDTLTSQSTTEALSANQGRLLNETKVNKSGDTFTGAIKSVSDSFENIATPFAITQRGIQSYSNVYIHADTDNSESDERVIITAGKGVSTNKADGLSVGANEMAWLGDKVNFDNSGHVRTSGRYFAKTAYQYAQLNQLTFNTASYNTAEVVFARDNFGYAPFIGGSTITSNSGYRQHISFGGFRGSNNWWGCGAYIALGGNDQYATEAYHFLYNGEIKHTAGDIELFGNAKTATKLKTARTIFGARFDGSGDVSADHVEISTNQRNTEAGVVIVRDDLFVLEATSSRTFVLNYRARSTGGDDYALAFPKKSGTLATLEDLPITVKDYSRTIKGTSSAGNSMDIVVSGQVVVEASKKITQYFHFKDFKDFWFETEEASVGYRSDSVGFTIPINLWTTMPNKVLSVTAQIVRATSATKSTNYKVEAAEHNVGWNLRRDPQSRTDVYVDIGRVTGGASEEIDMFVKVEGY